jgi:hypothetical protein
MGTSNLFVNTIKPYRPLPVRLKSRTDRLSTSKLLSKPDTVGSILAETRPVPAQSVLLGRCSDQLPFFLSLTDPELGSILVSGDEGCGKTHQLQVMVDSAINTNAPHQLQIAVLTHHPEDWDRICLHSRQKMFIQGCYAWYDKRAEGLINSLADLAEARRESRQTGPDILFVLDDLNYVEGLSLEAQVNLRWLLSYGAQSNIWVVAAIKASYALELGYWLEPFRTRILGRTCLAQQAETLSLQPGALLKDLSHNVFRAWTGSQWLTYRLPLLGG